MDIEKRFVHLVTGRVKLNQEKRGVLTNYLVCSLNSDNVRELIKKEKPNFEMISIVNVLVYEETLKNIRAVLAGDNVNWETLVDPELKNLETA